GGEDVAFPAETAGSTDRDAEQHERARCRDEDADPDAQLVAIAKDTGHVMVYRVDQDGSDRDEEEEDAYKRNAAAQPPEAESRLKDLLPEHRVVTDARPAPVFRIPLHARRAAL